MSRSRKKFLERIAAEERARYQGARPTLFERDPGKVNRSASRMVPAPRKGSRGDQRRRALADFR